MQIEWEYGSDVIGDFSWCGYSIVVVDRVKSFLISKKFECDFGKVEVLKNSTHKRNNKMQMVSYPYQGPNLNWLIPKVTINLSIEKTKLNLETDCPECKLKEYEFKMDGIIIPKSELNGEKMFRIKQFGLSQATYVTEDGLQELLIKDFSNFWYKEAGYIE
ncbi:MAG: hypothetical protein ACOYVD_16780 [Bacillota bacterium]